MTDSQKHEELFAVLLEERKAVLLIEAKARHIELSEKPTPLACARMAHHLSGVWILKSRCRM